MDIYRIIGNAALLTVVWVIFAINGQRFTQESPPRANVGPSQTIEVHGQTVDVPMPNADAIRSEEANLMFVTQEAFQREMEEYSRAHMLHGGLAVVFGLAVFVIGAKLGEHWGYGLACVLFGPLAVAYTGYRKARLT
jgi:hypothetical protein